MSRLSRQVWPFVVGAILGLVLAWYTDSAWITGIIILMLVVIALRRRRRPSPPA